MSRIERVASNTPWEPVFGYSRAVRAGEWLAVSGTTATDERGMLVGAGQMYVQARQALLNLKSHIERAGLSTENIVRTRVFVTDISRFAEVARAHKEVLGDNPPASSCLEVKRLVHPDMLVEIEADVYAGGRMPSPEKVEEPAAAAAGNAPESGPPPAPAPKPTDKAAPRRPKTKSRPGPARQKSRGKRR